MKSKLSEARKILEEGCVGAGRARVGTCMAWAESADMIVDIRIRHHRDPAESARAVVAAWKAAMAELGRNPKAKKSHGQRIVDDLKKLNSDLRFGKPVPCTTVRVTRTKGVFNPKARKR